MTWTGRGRTQIAAVAAEIGPAHCRVFATCLAELDMRAPEPVPGDCQVIGFSFIYKSRTLCALRPDAFCMDIDCHTVLYISRRPRRSAGASTPRHRHRDSVPRANLNLTTIMYLIRTRGLTRFCAILLMHGGQRYTATGRKMERKNRR